MRLQTPGSRYKLPRASSISPVIKRVPASLQKQGCSIPVGQYDNHVLSTEALSTIIAPSPNHMAHFSTSPSRTCTRDKQSSCRTPQQDAATSPLMGTQPQRPPAILSQVEISTNRLVCNPRKRKMPKLRI